MGRSPVHSSIVLAVAAAMLSAGLALADTVAADGDLVTAGNQNSVDLGAVAPGATVTRDVTFTLVCAGLRHADAGQTLTVSPSATTVPLEGGSISATDGAIGPVPESWVNDAAGIIGCPSAMTLPASAPSHVTIVAPGAPGNDYAFTILYAKALAPAGVADLSSVSGATGITFVLDVIEADDDTTPPTLSGVPADLDLVTADPAGAVLDYPLPTATDDRDPAPVVACDPAPGTLIPPGTTTVTCTATDASGNGATATFRAVVHLATVAWESPVPLAGTLTVTRGRSLPVKARAWFDGADRDGVAGLVITSCDPSVAAATGTERTVAMERQAEAGRWMTVLDTTGLAAGCHRVGLAVDGSLAGSFMLTIVDPPASTPGAAKPRG
jgi:hypothetical protein